MDHRLIITQALKLWYFNIKNIEKWIQKGEICLSIRHLWKEEKKRCYNFFPLPTPVSDEELTRLSILRFLNCICSRTVLLCLLVFILVNKQTFKIYNNNKLSKEIYWISCGECFTQFSVFKVCALLNARINT